MVCMLILVHYVQTVHTLYTYFGVYGAQICRGSYQVHEQGFTEVEEAKEV